MHTIMIDIDAHQRQVESHALIFAGQHPNGPQLSANSRCFLRDGIPWFPIMGEIHFSRYPRAYWEESILKIQAGGIDIIASYVFWIHHEEIEGELEWHDNKDLKSFVKLCGKHNFPLFLRIGPWCHGECRNGGLPDWLLKKEFESRTNDDRYFACVQGWYAAIYEQIKGLLYKDGGPIIGIQIENEYGHCGGLQGEQGKHHMRALKKNAREIGFDVPFYTATGWGGAIVLEDELLPVMSAYASMPWTQHTEALPPSVHYLFSETRDDFLVGADLATQSAMLTYNPEKYPYALAELGPGNQCTAHRRPLVTARDVEAMVLVKIGSGANLIGYYMFHGGSNPVGKRSTMQESRETGYLNDLPVISYDFQAPIGEYGQLSQTYRNLKILHLFLHDFGEQLAQTRPILPPENPEDPSDVETLRWAIRDHQGSGFLFLNNYQKNLEMEEKNNCILQLVCGRETIEFPEFDLSGGRYCILPYRFQMGDMLLKNATAQLLCRTRYQDEDYYLFFSYPELRSQYVFAKQGVKTIHSQMAEITESDICFTARVSRMGLEDMITLQSHTGRSVHLITLTREQAENCWKADLWGRERLVISAGNLTWTNEEMSLCVTGPGTASFSLFPNVKTGLMTDGQVLAGEQEGIFSTYTLHQPQQDIPVSVKDLGKTGDGCWHWEIAVSEDALSDVNDIFLRIEFEGNVAELFLDGMLVADWFYDGRVWEVGLKRFADRLRNQSFRLKISPLTDEETIYLEKYPQYENGVVLRLNHVIAVPQYAVAIQQC